MYPICKKASKQATKILKKQTETGQHSIFNAEGI